MNKPIVVIGGGLSGLAAAIRCSRYSSDVLLLEKHSRIGGLNSYYQRNGFFIETGLHAITNFAKPNIKKAPLNRLLRQLKLKRKSFNLVAQKECEIFFEGQESLFFANDFSILDSSILHAFPGTHKDFQRLVQAIDEYDPFSSPPNNSAKKFIASFLGNHILVDMLLCPSYVLRVI